MQEYIKAAVCFVPFSLFFLVIVYSYDIAMFFGKMRCRNGKHLFKKGRYFCIRCSVARDWPKLTCLNGEKKDRPKFPGI